MSKTNEQFYTLTNSKVDFSKLAAIGTILTVKPDTSSKFQSTVPLRTFLPGQTENCGFVGTNHLAQKSLLAKDLHKVMEENEKLDGIDVIVVGFEKVLMGANNSREVEVAIAQVVETEILDKDLQVLPGEVVFELKVGGTTNKNVKKVEVIKSIRSGAGVTHVTLNYEEKDGMAEIVAMYDNGRAGVILESSPNYNEAVKVMSMVKTMTVTAKDPLNSGYIAVLKVDEETMEFIRTGKRPLTLEQIKEEKSAFIPMERLERIQSYLEKSGVSKKQIMKVMQTYRNYPAEVQSRIPEPTVAFADSFSGVKKTVVYLNKGKHIRLIGEKGTGKNLLTSTLAWIYQRPLFELSMNAQTDKLDLLGSKTFEEVMVDDKPVSRIGFQKEALVEAMEYGGFLNLDEVNTADPAVLVLLHSIVDDRGSIEVPSYKRVQADDNFAMILTMNVDYVGTTPLNEATRDRFTPILFPNNESIQKLLKARVPSAKAEDIQLADRVYKEMMKLVVDGRLSMDCITVRGFIDALEVMDELGLEEALIDNVVNRVEDMEYRQTVSNIVDDIVG